MPRVHDLGTDLLRKADKLTPKSPSLLTTRFRPDVHRDLDLDMMVRGLAIDVARLQSEVTALDARVDASIESTRDRTQIIFNSSQRAIDKAEQAQNSYNASHNDLARKMEEQYSHMLPRAEASAILDRMREDIKDLRDAQQTSGGQSKGMREMWGWVFGIAMAFAGLAVAISALFKG